MCRDYQIPHSQFLSWSKADRDKAVWHHLRERSRCRGCGTRPEEWDESQGGHRHAYRAVAQRCRGCELLGREREQLDKARERGAFVILQRGG